MAKPRTFDPPQHTPADRFEAMHEAVVAARAMRKAKSDEQSTQAFDVAMAKLEKIERYLGIQ
jgi:hypothetical protein